MWRRKKKRPRERGNKLFCLPCRCCFRLACPPYLVYGPLYSLSWQRQRGGGRRTVNLPYAWCGCLLLACSQASRQKGRQHTTSSCLRRRTSCPLFTIHLKFGARITRCRRCACIPCCVSSRDILMKEKKKRKKKKDASCVAVGQPFRVSVTQTREAFTRVAYAWGRGKDCPLGSPWRL